jgi:hypothetical protein
MAGGVASLPLLHCPLLALPAAQPGVWHGALSLVLLPNEHAGAGAVLRPTRYETTKLVLRAAEAAGEAAAPLEAGAAEACGGGSLGLKAGSPEFECRGNRS